MVLGATWVWGAVDSQAHATRPALVLASITHSSVLPCGYFPTMLYSLGVSQYWAKVALVISESKH